MKPSSLLPSLPALLLVGSSAAAQTTFAGARHGVPLTGGSAFGRAVACDLDGDGVLDLVQRHDGGAATALLAPAELEAPIALPGARADLDLVPGAAPSGADALVEIDAAGLRLAWLDVATGFVQGAGFAQEVAGGGLVRALELDGAPGVDLLALAADGTTLHAYAAAGGGYAHAFVHPAGAAVREALLVEWDGSAPPELALATDLGIEVHAVGPGGLTPVHSQAALAPGALLARVGQVGLASERLAWVTPSPAAGQWLLVLGATGAPEHVDLGSLGATALVAGDSGLDGFDDLLLNHTFSHELLGMTNLRSGAVPGAVSFTGALAQLVLFPLGPLGAAPGNAARPVLADLDRDGDLDVACADESLQEVLVLSGEAVDEELLRPQITGTGTYQVGAGGSGTLTLTLVTAQDAPLPPALDVRLDVWRQPAYPGPVLSARTTRQVAFDGGHPLQIPLPEATATDVFAIRLRFVDRAPQGRGQLPALCGYLTMDGAILQSLTGGVLPYVPVNFGGGGEHPGGGFVVRPPLGPFSGSTPP